MSGFIICNSYGTIELFDFSDMSTNMLLTGCFTSYTCFTCISMHIGCTNFGPQLGSFGPKLDLVAKQGEKIFGTMYHTMQYGSDFILEVSEVCIFS